MPDATRLAMLIAARAALAEGRDACAAALEAVQARHPALPAALLANAARLAASEPPAG